MLVRFVCLVHLCLAVKFCVVDRFAYFVVYTWVSGATMTEITYVSTITSLLSFVLALIPFCVLKTTMVVED